MTNQPTTFCRRCGTCCKNGGPALHLEDRPAVEQGLIPLRSLVTLRKGELARDPVAGELRPLAGEIIKIKGSGPVWTCLYYDQGQGTCRIYPQRPLECRLLKCWDTADFEASYQRNRLTRKDLLAEVDGWGELVADHERRCRYADIERLIARAGQTNAAGGFRELAEKIAFDIEVRRRVVEKGRLDPQILDFLFGRRLLKTLQAMYGLSFRRESGKIEISSFELIGINPHRRGAKSAE
jgi:Fe-S-cluster containining protein